MMRFIPESGSPADRVATFVLSNIFWFMLAAPIITLPAATAGLFATMAPWVRGHDVEFFSTFFGAMRRHWWKSSLIVLFDVVVGLLIYMNFTILNAMTLPIAISWMIRSVNISAALIVLLMNLYMWTLMVLFDLPLRRLWNVASRLTLVHPLWSAITLVLACLPILAGQFVPVWLNVMLTASATAFITNWGTWRIIKKYATEQELAELGIHSG